MWCKRLGSLSIVVVFQLFLGSVVVKGKVKCTHAQVLRLCSGRTAHRGSRGIALLFLDHGIRRGWGVSVTPRPLFTRGKTPVPILQEAGWTPGPVWTGAENLASTGIRSPDRPARSESLYRLRYPAHKCYWKNVKFTPANITANWAFNHFGFMVSPVNNRNHWTNHRIIVNTAPIDRT